MAATRPVLAIELTRLCNWAALPPADAETLFDEPEPNEVMAWTNAQPLAEQQALLAALPALLPAMHPVKAAAVLIFGGGLVENGSDPDTLLPAGLAHLRYLTELCDQGEQLPEAAWRFTVIGLMAMLCRSAVGRALWKQQTDLHAWLTAHEELSDHFDYLLHLVKISDEDVLWVILPSYETGLEVSVEQVNNTFHLLTLVQPLVREHAAALRLRRPPPATDPAVLAFARGEQSDPTDIRDHARLEWLTADAYAGPGQELHHASIAWGEAPVSTGLPRVRGHVLLLADDPEEHIQRSWDAGFLVSMHGANRAAVRLRRVLPAAEVRDLLAELAQQAAAPRTWLALPDATPAARPGFWRRLLGG